MYDVPHGKARCHRALRMDRIIQILLSVVSDMDNRTYSSAVPVQKLERTALMCVCV